MSDIVSTSTHCLAISGTALAAALWSLFIVLARRREHRKLRTMFNERIATLNAAIKRYENYFEQLERQ